jgi:hypothetical protein
MDAYELMPEHPPGIDIVRRFFAGNRPLQKPSTGYPVQ